MQASSRFETTLKDRKSTLGFPSWLITLACLLLPARLAYVAYGSLNHSAPPTLASLTPTNDASRPNLYVILGKGTASQRLAEDLQNNRPVRQLISSNFNLITLQDAQKNPQEKRICAKYNIWLLPVVVAATQSGKEISELSLFGYSSRQLHFFLTDALLQRHFAEGKELLRRDEASKARSELAYYLANSEESAGGRRWAVYDSIICELRLKHKQAAVALAQDWLKEEPHGAYVSPLYRYLTGKCSARDMTDETSTEPSFAEGPHMLVALNMLCEGKPDQALPELKWLSTRGAPKSLERMLAVQMLKHDWPGQLPPEAEKVGTGSTTDISGE